MLTFLCLPKIENMIDKEIQHNNWNSKHYYKREFALKFIGFSMVFNLFTLEVVQKCQRCQLCVLREYSIGNAQKTVVRYRTRKVIRLALLL